MKRRIAALWMALLILLSTSTAVADQVGEVPEKTLTKENLLVVGNTTPMRGEFFTDMWGNATSDADVRDLLHAYNLIYWDGAEGMFTADPSVVSNITMTENESGDHTYVMVLHDDLYYSDGSRITAWDYAFSFLLSISPILSEIGARPVRCEQIVGYREYIDVGKTLSGIRVIRDDTLSVTLNHEYLPFFYEMGLIACNPYPIYVIAPGIEVRDDGDGVYLANIDPNVTEPIFTAELLRSTIMDPVSGYQSHPSVVSGPYILTGWDGVTAEFEINPYFKGDRRGNKPTISHLTYTLADNDTMMEELCSGEFGLLNKVMRVDQVSAGLKQIGNGASICMTNYPRSGLSFIGFACERTTVADVAVRTAIAYCFDRNAVVTDYTGSFGTRVDGYYGTGQWMYEIATSLTELSQKDEGGDTAYQELTLEQLNPYALNLPMARRILDDAGWSLNADGLREKDGVVLDLRLIYPEGNNIYESLQSCLVDNLKTVGIRLILEAVPMQELLTRWYKQGERSDDMFYLASNFDTVFDPSVHFSSDGAWSYTNLVDEELYKAAVSMRTTEPGDVLTYMRRWVIFEERFNTILPMIPVYSNLYFDFYRDDLQGYYITQNTSWGQAVVGAWTGVPPEAGAY